MQSNEQRRKRWKERKKAIIDFLGGKCALQSPRCKGPLTIDHINGRNYYISGGSILKIYEQEAKEGKLRVLCLYHNSRDGAFKKNRGVRKNYHVENKKCFCSRCRTVTGVFPAIGERLAAGSLHGRILRKFSTRKWSPAK